VTFLALIASGFWGLVFQAVRLWDWAVGRPLPRPKWIELKLDRWRGR
jgi:hypothetical protein